MTEQEKEGVGPSTPESELQEVFKTFIEVKKRHEATFLEMREKYGQVGFGEFMEHVRKWAKEARAIDDLENAVRAIAKRVQ